MKKYSIICVAAAAMALAGGVQAGDFVTRAKVLDSKPIIETVYEPYESCSYETRRQRSRTRGSNTGEKIIGGVLGGAAGSAIGSGTGRDIAAGAGAFLGSELADGDGVSEGEIIGGIAGGIVGNQVGKGRGKTVATSAGVLLGAIVGDNLQHGGAKQQQSGAGEKVRVCEQKERAKKVITGYEVIYEYAGLKQTGVLPYAPGEYVDINVGVELVEDRTSRAVN